jgi:hypothetical protein
LNLTKGFDALGRTDIDALVLVDGGFPNGYSQPVRSLPPLLLIWGSADQTFPLLIGQELQRTAKGSERLSVLTFIRAEHMIFS